MSKQKQSTVIEFNTPRLLKGTAITFFDEFSHFSIAFQLSFHRQLLLCSQKSLLAHRQPWKLNGYLIMIYLFTHTITANHLSKKKKLKGSLEKSRQVPCKKNIGLCLSGLSTTFQVAGKNF